MSGRSQKSAACWGEGFKGIGHGDDSQMSSHDLGSQLTGYRGGTAQRLAFTSILVKGCVRSTQLKTIILPCSGQDLRRVARYRANELLRDLFEKISPHLQSQSICSSDLGLSAPSLT